MRAGRHARGADIADHLALPDSGARRYCDPAHMAVAARHAAAVRELDEIAVAAGSPGERDDAVGHCVDRRAVRGADVEPLVHPREAEQRMEAHAVVRGYPADHRHARHRAALGLAVRIEPAAAAGFVIGIDVRRVGREPDELHFPAPLVDAGEQQVADPGLAGRRALTLDDHVEGVRRRHVAADRKAGRDRLDERLHCLSGDAGGARGSVQAGADQALDPQRRRIDRDRLAVHGQPARTARQRQRQIEPRAEIQLLQRTRDGAVGPAPERQRDPRAGRDRLGVDRLRDQRRGGLRIAPADACTHQRPIERIALAQRRGQFECRTFGGIGERRDEVVRRHPPSGGRALGERRDALRPRLLPLRAGERRRHRADQRLEPRCEHHRRGAQRGAGRESAPPVAAADPCAEIGDPVDARRGGLRGGGGETIARTAEPACSAARQFPG